MKVCVIGAGTMGSGIAQVFSAAGHEVALYASSPQSAQKHIDKLAAGLSKQVAKGRMDEETKAAILGRIEVGYDQHKQQADLILESAKEDMCLKKELFAELDAMCKSDCVFATNTSSLSITEMGFGLTHPVIGMHFFNPAPAMKLVEVIPGINTPDELVEKITTLAVELGKTPVNVKEAPGFVVNRILVPMINEAIGIYAEGIASVEDIDQAMKLGANHPMGPLALGDLIGLDVVLFIMDTLYNETGDGKYRAHILLRKMVRGGLLGRKTKKGFYTY